MAKSFTCISTALPELIIAGKRQLSWLQNFHLLKDALKMEKNGV